MGGYQHRTVGVETDTAKLAWLAALPPNAFSDAVIFIIFLTMAEGGSFNRGAMTCPVRLWLVYGLVSLGICINSPKPLDPAYWAVNYLAVFAAMALYLHGEDNLARAVQLNYLSWFVTALFLTILVFVARDVLFVDYRHGWITGYGIFQRVGTVADTAMSRSSGMARLAAIPGIVAFVFLFASNG